MGELQLQLREKLERESGKDVRLKQLAELLLRLAGEDIGVCTAVLAEERTLSGAFAELEAAARKRYEHDRKQRCVCVTAAEAEKLVAAYYGFTKAEATHTPPQERRRVISLFDMARR